MSVKITIISVGKEKTDYYDEAITEFTHRVRHYSHIDWIYIKPSKNINSSTQIQKNEEGEKILEAIPLHSYVILLDERGKQISSTSHAELHEKLKNEGIENIVYIIGGAFGVSEAVKERAQYILSFSLSVFPYELVRLILIEQIYRSETIQRGEKYHHE